MQLVSYKIWTRVVVSISYDDNHYTTGTFYPNRSIEVIMEQNRSTSQLVYECEHLYVCMCFESESERDRQNESER